MDGDFTPLTNPSFSSQIPGLQLSWDATSYSALINCARYYYYNIVLGYTLKGDEEAGELSGNVHFDFGIFLHSASEFYDRLKADGADHEEALRETFKFLINKTWNNELKRPWTSDEPTKTRNTLLRTVIWYLDKYKDENLTTYILPDGRPAVELPFRFNLSGLSTQGNFKAPTGEEYQACGYLDKVVSWNEELWIRDIKTTKFELDDIYFSQYTPNVQVSIYSIAGTVVLHQQVDGMIIDGIQVQVGGSKFRRKPIPRSPEMLEEFLDDFQIKIREAENYAINKKYPMNPKSCGWGKNQCQFRPICSSEPIGRFDLLENYYTKRLWNPLEPR